MVEKVGDEAGLRTMIPLKQEPLPVKIAFWAIFGALLTVILSPVLASLNSIFPLTKEMVETIVGTFIAAGAGTWGAQIVIEKTKNKELLTNEIRSTNAAIVLAFDTCNTYLSLKKQIVKSIKDRFDAQLAFVLHPPTVPPGNTLVVDLELDFRTVAPVFAATDALQQLMFEKISVTGRPLALTAALIRSVDTVNISINKRNEMSDVFKLLPRATAADEKARKALYFGLPMNGRTDTHFRDNIKALYEQVDNCIQFGMMLCQDLHAHGQALREKFGEGAPRVGTTDFSMAAAAGLLPDSANFSDWESAFVKLPADKR